MGDPHRAEVLALGDLRGVALEHLQLELGLAVVRRRDLVRLPRRERGVPRQDGHHPAAREADPDPHREDVDEDDRVDARGRVGEERRAHRDRLVGVDALVRLAPELLRDLAPDERHPALAADEEHLADVPGAEPLRREHLAADLERPVDEPLGEPLELGARHLDLQVVLLAVGGAAQVRDARDGALARGERDLRLLGGVADPLPGDRVLRRREPALLGEPPDEVVDELRVEVDPAEEGVAAGRDHLVHVALDLEDGGVERPAAEVVHEDPLVETATVPERERGGGGLVHDPLDVEPRERARLADRAPLVVVVVGRHRDDRPGDGLAERLRSPSRASPSG